MALAVLGLTTSKAQEDLTIAENVAQRTIIQNHCGNWELAADINSKVTGRKMITTALFDLKRYKIALPVSINSGGLDSCGPNLIILSGAVGKVFNLDMTSMQLQELLITLPNNEKDELATFAESFKKEIKLHWHRYNDIAFWVDKEGDLFLLLSYSYWNAQDECFTSRLAKTKISKELSELDSKDINWTVFFETSPCFAPNSFKGHPYAGHQAGGRMYALNAEEIVLTVGDYEFDGRNSDPKYPQFPDNHYGKTFKVKVEDGTTDLLSIGHRNHQGITVDDFGQIWSVEHGAQGGDELNLITTGANYGWPEVTYGTHYGTFEWPFSKAQGRHEGFEKPIYAWVPSIAVSNIDVIRDFIDLWDQDLLIASLRGETLYRARIHDERVIFAEPINLDKRLRYVHNIGNKTIAVLTDGEESKASIFILRPSALALKAETARMAEVTSNKEISIEDETEVEVAFTQCLECHGNQTASGSVPSLKGVYGRKAGSGDFDNYSEALLQSEVYWNEDELLEYLKTQIILLKEHLCQIQEYQMSKR